MAKVIVLGGSGFVGQRVCQSLVRLGARAVSLSKSGPPPPTRAIDRVKYVTGDVFSDAWHAELEGAAGVVSCIG